jgi:beta-lactamase class A
VRSRSPFSALRFISVMMIMVAIILTALELVRFSRVRSLLPAGLVIAGIPVGGRDSSQATEIIQDMYSTPVELHYSDAVIQMSPGVVDFHLDLENMLALANLERTQKQFWTDFWDYLWGRTTFPTQIPLSATFSDVRLRAYLSEIATRYDTPAEPSMPIPGRTEFAPGKAGKVLDADTAVALIESALNSLTNRSVQLPLKRIEPSRPSFKNLEVLLKQTLEVNNFEGLAGIYLLDLQTGEEIHFGYLDGQDISVEPDIAFTASSTIKIPIMVGVFRRIGVNPDAETLKLLTDMVDKSGNEAADWLMQRVVDEARGPLLITEDMRLLGLQNTFLGGYFTYGSPLLEVFSTPANQRTDVSTDPDPYSQTTPSDMGMLLEDIYQCSQTGGGALTAVFSGEVTQTECLNMINYLLENRLPMLLTAGLPEATPIAHKHGWVTTNGVILTISDAGIIYSPGGNYILVVELYHPEQLLWDPASALVAELSKAAYNYFNLPQE